MKTLKKFVVTARAALTVAVTAAVAVAPIAYAQSTKDPGKMDGMKVVQTAAASEMTEGEVRKVDLEGGKVTLKHAEIKNLDMPGMTMVFVVKDKAMLDKLKPGDKVQFKAINDGGKFTVTAIQPAR